LVKLDEFLGKAIEDKNLQLILSSLKDLHLLFKDFSDPLSQAQYFESFQIFNSGLVKRMQSTKLLTMMS